MVEPLPYPEQAFANLVFEFDKISLWIKGLGFFIIAWLIYSLILLTLQRRKLKRLEIIENKLDSLDKKISLLVKKK